MRGDLREGEGSTTFDPQADTDVCGFTFHVGVSGLPGQAADWSGFVGAATGADDVQPVLAEVVEPEPHARLSAFVGTDPDPDGPGSEDFQVLLEVEAGASHPTPSVGTASQPLVSQVVFELAVVSVAEAFQLEVDGVLLFQPRPLLLLLSDHEGKLASFFALYLSHCLLRSLSLSI